MLRYLTHILSVTAIYAAFVFVPVPAADHHDAGALQASAAIESHVAPSQAA